MGCIEVLGSTCSRCKIINMFKIFIAFFSHSFDKIYNAYTGRKGIVDLWVKSGMLHYGDKHGIGNTEWLVILHLLS